MSFTSGIITITSKISSRSRKGNFKNWSPKLLLFALKDQMMRVASRMTLAKLIVAIMPSRIIFYCSELIQTVVKAITRIATCTLSAGIS